MSLVKQIITQLKSCVPSLKLWGLSGLMVKLFALTIMAFIWLYLYFVVVGYFYDIAVEKGMGYMPHINNLLITIGGASFAGTVVLLAKYMVDRNNNGIPDEIEKEEEKNNHRQI